MNDRDPRARGEQERLASRLKALAHPARLRILEVLAARGSCVCGAIVEVMPLAQATVSQHLKVLREAGLVRGTIDGPRSCYCIDPDAVRALRADLAAFLETLPGTGRGAEEGREPLPPRDPEDHRRTRGDGR